MPLLGCFAKLILIVIEVLQKWFLLKWESSPTLTKYYWVVQFIIHGQSSSLKASFEIELGPLDFNMVSEHTSPPIMVRHSWGGILKWESSLTLIKYYWVMQFMIHGQSSSLKTSFEIELGPLDFNNSYWTRNQWWCFR